MAKTKKEAQTKVAKTSAACLPAKAENKQMPAVAKPVGVEEKSSAPVAKPEKQRQWGKCPIHFTKEEGESKITFKNPDDPNNCSVLERLTGTQDIDLAGEILSGYAALAKPISTSIDNMNVALQSLADSAPKDATEARLCLQAHALHSQGMQYLAKVANASSSMYSEFCMKSAIKLLRLHNETVEAISKYKRGGEQKIVIQHQNVQVNSGGQAIVGGGDVVAGGREGGGVNGKFGEVSP